MRSCDVTTPNQLAQRLRLRTIVAGVDSRQEIIIMLNALLQGATYLLESEGTESQYG